MILHSTLPLEKEASRPVDSKNGLTLKNPLIGIGDIGINVGGLGIYESTKKLGLPAS